jgi:hypothetical protein
LCSIRYGAAPIKTNGAFERMVGFSLVESDHYTAAEFGILELSQGKQCPFNPPNLPQCGRHRRLSRIGGELSD